MTLRIERIDKLGLWVVALVTLMATLLLGGAVANDVFRGPSVGHIHFDENYFGHPTRKTIFVEAGSGAEIVVRTTDRLPNAWAELTSLEGFGEPGAGVSRDDDESVTVVAFCDRFGPLPAFRRWCHVSVNLQVLPGSVIHVRTTDGGVVRQASADLQFVRDN